MSSPLGNGRQPGPAPDALYTPAQVAAMLGGNVTARTVVRRWRSWGLTAYRIGRELRFKGSDIYAMIAAHKIPPPVPAPDNTSTRAARRRRRT